MRKKKLILNTTISLLNQLITIICGFILPRFFLQYYGSEINGLVSSMVQFLGFISLMELGIGAVVQSTLYKPLAEKNILKISCIIKSAEKFFHKIASIFLIYVIILTIFYPIYIKSNYSWIFNASLIVILSINSLGQYYFGITYQLLLTADQRAYITLGLQGLTLILNTITSIVLINLGMSIQIVKLASTFIFLIKPFAQNIYVKRYYRIDKKIQLTDEPIKQKWNGIAQHIASFILENTDIMVLTFFSTLVNVSIYSIYNLVVVGVKQLIRALTIGIQSLFGNMLAKREIELLNKRFLQYEWIMHTIVIFCYTCTGLLIGPFVNVYTNGVNDANYVVPLFGILLTTAQAAYCLRLPYNEMVLAAGHYKQTQASAIIEMCINLIISILLVVKFGLVGVAIGTLIAMIYRTIYLAYYLSKKSSNIIKYQFTFFLKHLLVDSFMSISIVFFTQEFALLKVTYLSLFNLAIKIFGVAALVVLIINFVFYRKMMLQIIRNLSFKFKKKGA